jgi:pilus assembly protein CpaE
MYRILNISHDISLTDRLTLALRDSAGVVQADLSADRLHEMVATVQPDLTVIDFAADSSEFSTAIAIIRILQEIDPARPIVAIGDEMSTPVVLAAVRAGARDFLAHGAEADVVRAQIFAQLDRASRHASGPPGQITLITSGQPNDGEGLFAVNFAVMQAQQGGDVLLLDFHLPTTIAGPALDLGLNYTIRDGVHDMARLDRTLLSTVLCRHQSSGLYVLPLALGAKEAIDVASSEILVLVKMLRGMFRSVIINLAGLHHGGLVADLLSGSERCYLVTSQRFTSIKACRELLADIPGAEMRVTLVVHEYDPAILLTDVQIKTTLGLARSIRLPRALAGLINAANRGVPLVNDQPKSAYTKAIANLVGTAPPRDLLAILRRREPSQRPARASHTMTGLRNFIRLLNSVARGAYQHIRRSRARVARQA